MPHISQMKNSKFLKKEDCGNGKLVTIREVVEENVALESQPKKMKWVCYFEDEEKGLVLNSINAETIADILNEDNSDNWGGGVIVLYDDPNVSFAGKREGGIRVRAPRGKAAEANANRGRSQHHPSDQDGGGEPESDDPGF